MKDKTLKRGQTMIAVKNSRKGIILLANPNVISTLLNIVVLSFPGQEMLRTKSKEKPL
ncbi:MAG: hypothetical protein LBF49_00445 [Puniceicoccales bacterium]|jgi:hypothetical protein|nr:hypothetical protein [Puniceicoccales bacterium]